MEKCTREERHTEKRTQEYDITGKKAHTVLKMTPAYLFSYKLQEEQEAGNRILPSIAYCKGTHYRNSFNFYFLLDVIKMIDSVCLFFHCPQNCMCLVSCNP